MERQQNEIKKLIFKHFPSESALARQLKWPRQRLNKITNGIRLPTIEETNDLSLALDVPVSDLVQIFLEQKSPNG